MKSSIGSFVLAPLTGVPNTDTARYAPHVQTMRPNNMYYSYFTRNCNFLCRISCLTTSRCQVTLRDSIGRQPRQRLCYIYMPFLPARRYASAATRYGPVSVCQSVRNKSVFYGNGWTDRASFFGMAASFDLHSVIRKFRYREKQGYFPAGTLS